ncbi:MAG: ComF family protein [Desulfocapsa sp.]|nr:ComF family protein [Desulfocapsa sp.]
MDQKQVAILQRWLKGVWDLLFPPSCFVCSAFLSDGARGICSDCLQDAPLIISPLCPVCGRGMSDSAVGDHLCGSCLRKKPPYSSVRGIVHYQEPVAPLLHSLKYQGDTSVLPALQAIVTLGLPETPSEEDRIIPVPLHIHRLRQRGFNQALLLAQLFFPERKNCILRDTLQRIRHTVPQTGLDGAARRKNMSKAFRVCDPGEVRGRKIILVDDVYTTGTTVSECSRVLLTAGAGEVSVLTLARVRE